MSSSADRHLGGLCEWGLPKGGMFFWMRAKGVKNTWDLIMNRYVKGEKNRKKPQYSIDMTKSGSKSGGILQKVATLGAMLVRAYVHCPTPVLV